MRNRISFPIGGSFLPSRIKLKKNAAPFENGTVEYTFLAKLLHCSRNHADFVNANEDIVLPELYLRGKIFGTM